MRRLIKKNRTLGIRIFWYDAVDSTNEVLKQMALKGEAEGAVVVAESQTRGRGRLGRTWFSPAGKGLYFSLLIRPILAPDQAGIVSIMTAAAVARAIQRNCRIRPELKWPNDLMISGKKIGGILCESHCFKGMPQFMVIGVGINTGMEPHDFPAELSRYSASLSTAGGQAVDRHRLLQSILRQMRHLYPSLHEDRTAIINQWLPFCRILEREVTIRQDGVTLSGIFKGISENGAAFLELPTSELVTVENGEVSLRENHLCY